MNRLINENADILANAFNEKHSKSIENYLAIMNSGDSIDQSKFRTFYRMNGKGLSNEFYNVYFSILKTKSVGNDTLGLTNESATNDFLLILKGLYAVDSSNHKNRKDRKNKSKKIHFSFSSKLLHTLNPSCPIYDSKIAAFYFLPDTTAKTAEYRFELCKKQYEFLMDEYERIKKENLLDETISSFKSKVNDFEKISFTKQIDYILWHFITELQSGKILEKKIIYHR